MRHEVLHAGLADLAGSTSYHNLLRVISHSLLGGQIYLQECC
jgi:hypothetical protein